MKIILKIVFSCIFVFFKTLSNSLGVESPLFGKRLNFTLNSRNFDSKLSENKSYFCDNSRFFSKFVNFGESEYAEIPEPGTLTKIFKEDKITITNKQSDIDVNYLMLFRAGKCYKQELKVEDFMLDIFIEDEKNMKRINFEQFGGNKPTDIISLRDDLLYLKSDFHKNRSPLKPPEHYHLGEIFICPGFIKGVIESENNLDSKIVNKSWQNLNLGERGGVAARMKGISDINIRMYDHEKAEWFREMAEMEDALLDEFIKILPIDNLGVDS
uniref:Uncharacterized protein family UPF0054, putative n=1 Tax=Theileria annulata TaxID=5874 RepID=A0A3B0MWV6_THEAN